MTPRYQKLISLTKDGGPKGQHILLERLNIRTQTNLNEGVKYVSRNTRAFKVMGKAINVHTWQMQGYLDPKAEKDFVG